MAIAPIKNKEKGSSVRTKINQAFTDLATAQSDITAIEADITAIEADIIAIEADITSIEGDVSTLQSTVSSLSSSVSNKQDRNAITTLRAGYRSVTINTSLVLDASSDGTDKVFKLKATGTGHEIQMSPGTWQGGERYGFWNDPSSTHKYTFAPQPGFTLTYTGSLNADLASGSYGEIFMISDTEAIRTK